MSKFMVLLIAMSFITQLYREDCIYMHDNLGMSVSVDDCTKVLEMRFDNTTELDHNAHVGKDVIRR